MKLIHFVLLLFGTALCVSQTDAQWGQIGMADRGISEIAVGTSGLFAITSDSGCVFRTTDGGANWVQVVQTGGQHMAVAPNGTIFVSRQDSLFRSADAGDSWTWSGIPRETMTYNIWWTINGVAIGPSGYVFCGRTKCSQWYGAFGGHGDSLEMSTDNGLTWAPCGVCAGAAFAFASNLAVSLGGWGSYGPDWGGGGTTFGISGDGGLTWEEQPNPVCGSPIVWCSNGNLMAQASGIVLSADTGANWPLVSTLIPEALLALPRGGVLVGTEKSGIYFFTDNGDSLGTRNEGLTDLHVHAFALDSTGNVYAGTNAGIWRRPLSDLSLARLRVPQDFPTIQAAIDAAHHGDTVLVSEGTYYENIRYRGKAITVGSLYVIDGDTNHIGRTIIDGSRSTQPDSGSVVYFINDEDTTSVLCGFTITGGTGTPYNPYGHHFGNRYGGGVFCDSAGARLTRNIITRNRVVAEIAGGAGILASTISPTFNPVVILEGNQITDNYAENYYPYDAHCSGGGANLNGVECRVIGNVFERDTVVGPFGAQGGGLIVWCDPRAGSYAYPNGIVAENVFRSNVVHALGAGVDGGGLALKWTGKVTIRDNLFQSNTATSLFPSGYSYGGGLYVYDEEIGVDHQKAILNNRFLGNAVFCYYNNRGGGLMLNHTLATVSGNEFAANAVVRQGYSGGGGGISMNNSSFHVENNIIARNSSAIGAGGVFVEGLPENISEQLIANNTIVNNQGYSVGGLDANGASNLVVFNNIFWGDTATSGTGRPEIAVSGSIGAIAYCDVKGGYAGSGNVDQDPVFLAGDSLFHLLPTSPCIEGGIDSMQIGGIWYHAPTRDYDGMLRPMPAGTRPDIGAQEEQISVPAYAHDVALDHHYAHPGADSVCITAVLTNPLHHTAVLSAIVTDAVGTIRDSTLFFNDGLHGDGSAGDSIWGRCIGAPMDENFFGISVRMDDITQGSFRRLPNVEHFTTAGPVVVDSIATRRLSPTSDRVRMDLWLRNTGKDSTIRSIKAVLRTTAPEVKEFVVDNMFFGNLGPGQQNGPGAVYLFKVDTSVHSVDIAFTVEVSSNGVVYWMSEVTAHVTGIIASNAEIPAEYRLEQNYPNPFNPSTTIRYALPSRSHVTLSVYNTLGQKVRTLVDEVVDAGYQSVEFDASGLASGVYLYRLQAGSFVQSKRMLVLK